MTESVTEHVPALASYLEEVSSLLEPEQSWGSTNFLDRCQEDLVASSAFAVAAVVFFVQVFYYLEQVGCIQLLLLHVLLSLPSLPSTYLISELEREGCLYW